MSKLLIVFAAVLACIVCAHKIPTGEGIEILSMGNLSMAKTGDWLLILYAPWCPHCTTLLEQVPDIASKIKSKGGKATIGIVDADAEPAVQMQFSMHGFPSVFFAHDGEVYSFPSSTGRSPDTLSDFAVKDYTSQTPISGIKAPFGIPMRAFGLYSSVAITSYRFLEVYAKMWNIPPMWFFCGVAVFFAIIVITLMIVCARCRQPQKCPRKNAGAKKNKDNKDAAIAAPIIEQERIENPIEGAAVAQTEKVQEKVKKAKEEQKLRRRDANKDKEGIREQQKNADKKTKKTKSAPQQNRPTQQPQKSKRS